MPLRVFVKTARITVLTPPVVFHSSPTRHTCNRSRTATGSQYGRQSSFSRLHGGCRPIAEAWLSWRCHCGHGGAVAIPVRFDRTRGGTAELLTMFKVSTVSPRRSAVFTGFPRCYGDQRRSHCGTTAIMAVPLRFMPYKHRSDTVPPV